MRINRYIATYSNLSRRKAGALIEAGKVAVNRRPAHNGMDVGHQDIVVIEGKRLLPIKRESITVLLHKPVGYVCSRDGQGSPTVYDLLQNRMQHLNIAGRLDKDSSGLVILTDDGSLLQQLTHPSHNKEKIYEVGLDEPIKKADLDRLHTGVDIGDTRVSRLKVAPCKNIDHPNCYIITITEGRNRQIRRTIEALRYKVLRLHRTSLGAYKLGSLPVGEFQESRQASKVEQG